MGYKSVVKAGLIIVIIFSISFFIISTYLHYEERNHEYSNIVPANLSQKDRDKALQMVLSYPEIIKKINNKEYEIVKITGFKNSLTGEAVEPAQVLLFIKDTGRSYTINVSLKENKITSIFEHEEIIPPDLSNIKIYPTAGDYISSGENKTKIFLSGGEYPTTVDSKIVLLDYSFNYITLKRDDICFPDSANPGDLGIVISGALKNNYDRNYWITLSASAYDSSGNFLGQSLNSGPICGIIALYLESNETADFELHLKYNNEISRINLSGGLSEIVPP